MPAAATGGPDLIERHTLVELGVEIGEYQGYQGRKRYETGEEDQRIGECTTQ